MSLVIKFINPKIFMKRTTLNILLAGSVLLSACGGNMESNTNEDSEASETTTETTEAEPTPVSKGGTYNVDTENSVIEWEGVMLDKYSHNGIVMMSSGSITTDENGNITGGEFIMDLNTINEKGTGTFNSADKVAKLVGHLKSPDFFDVAKWPTAKIVLTGEEGGKINADLTIRDITKPISFNTSTLEEDGNTFNSTAEIVFNRAEWEIKYGSESFFDNLGDKIIGDDVKLTITLVAKK